jgi:hypothetical protein
MEELAQLLGDKKMPGEFDWDSSTNVYLNTNEAGPLGSNPVLGREEALSDAKKLDSTFVKNSR